MFFWSPIFDYRDYTRVQRVRLIGLTQEDYTSRIHPKKIFNTIELTKQWLGTKSNPEIVSKSDKYRYFPTEATKAIYIVEKNIKPIFDFSGK